MEFSIFGCWVLAPFPYYGDYIPFFQLKNNMILGQTRHCKPKWGKKDDKDNETLFPLKITNVMSY